MGSRTYTILTKIGQTLFIGIIHMHDYIEDCYNCIDRVETSTWRKIYILTGSLSAISITVGVFGILKSWGPHQLYEALFMLGILLIAGLIITCMFYVYDKVAS